QPRGSELIIAPWTAMIQSAQLFGHYPLSWYFLFTRGGFFADSRIVLGIVPIETVTFGILGSCSWWGRIGASDM
uniref:hypothetical protein n=1 Tax=Bifidobacterium adolescentis TaxID=1680 RepID=UPI00359C5990